MTAFILPTINNLLHKRFTQLTKDRNETLVGIWEAQKFVLIVEVLLNLKDNDNM